MLVKGGKKYNLSQIVQIDKKNFRFTIEYTDYLVNIEKIFANLDKYEFSLMLSLEKESQTKKMTKYVINSNVSNPRLESGVYQIEIYEQNDNANS